MPPNTPTLRLEVLAAIQNRGDYRKIEGHVTSLLGGASPRAVKGTGRIGSHGVAISPSQAAECLLDAHRTTVFLKALNAACRTELREKEGRIHLLEAGSGPTPLSILYAATNPDRFTVTAVDLSSASLDYAQRLAAATGVKLNAVQANLTEDFECHDQPDVILAEVMDRALLSEAQGAVTVALARKFGDQPIFMPESVTVEAFLNRSFAERDLHSMGSIIKVDRGFREEARRSTGPIREHMGVRGEFRTPQGWENGNLMLRTTVQVYGDQREYRIEPNTSVITGDLNLRFNQLDARQAGDPFQISYQMGQAVRSVQMSTI